MHTIDSGPSTISLTLLVAGLLLATLVTAPTALAADGEAPILTGHSAASALVVEVENRCSEVQLRVPESVVTWRIDATRAAVGTGVEALAASDEFRVDVSAFPKGLERGQFKSMTTARTEARRTSASAGRADSDAPESMAIVAGNLRAGVYYRTRVLARTPEGWIASREVHFMTPVCAVDGLDEIEGGVK